MDLLSRPKPAPKVDLKLIRIASPCPADWNKMAGDDLVRHCAECDLNVYNLSAMTERDIQRLLGNAQGRVCGRFYRRADGTILTQDCPRGLRAAARRVSRFVAAAVAAVMTVGTALAKPPQAKKPDKPAQNQQQQQASLTGNVLDPQGAVIAGAKVTLTSGDGKRVYTTMTHANGDYRFDGLPAGQYSLLVEASNFKAVTKRVSLSSQAVKQDVSMDVDQRYLTVGIIIESGSPEINTQDGSLGQTLAQKQISDLPHK